MDTKIETASDIRRFERSPGDTEVVANSASDDGTMPFRPLQRPPMAFVCALDDDQRSGAWYRTRRNWYLPDRHFLRQGNLTGRT